MPIHSLNRALRSNTGKTVLFTFKAFINAVGVLDNHALSGART